MQIIEYGTTRIAVERLSQPGLAAARQAVVALLARLLEVEPVAVGRRDDGEPFLPDFPGINVSISHSRDYAAVAVDPARRIGIDVERDRHDQLRRVAARFLSDAELTAWADRLLTAWTAKEALYKLAPGPVADYRADLALDSPGVCGRPCTLIHYPLPGDSLLTLAYFKLTT